MKSKKRWHTLRLSKPDHDFFLPSSKKSEFIPSISTIKRGAWGVLQKVVCEEMVGCGGGKTFFFIPALMIFDMIPIFYSILVECEHNVKCTSARKRQFFFLLVLVIFWQEDLELRNDIFFSVCSWPFERHFLWRSLRMSF